MATQGDQMVLDAEGVGRVGCVDCMGLRQCDLDRVRSCAHEDEIGPAGTCVGSGQWGVGGVGSGEWVVGSGK